MLEALLRQQTQMSEKRSKRKRRHKHALEDCVIFAVFETAISSCSVLDDFAE